MKYRLDKDEIFSAGLRWLRDRKGVVPAKGASMSVVVEEDRRTGRMMPFIDFEFEALDPVHCDRCATGIDVADKQGRPLCPDCRKYLLVNS